MRKRLGVLFGILSAAVVAAARPAVADEPYLAIRTGLKCSACHVNRTGGGGRNVFGANWGQTVLPMNPAQLRNRALTDWLSIGFDVRALGSAYVSDATPRTNIEMNEAQLQLEARLIQNVLTLYVDQTLGPERAFAREAFVMADVLPMRGYAKAGKFLLPYGWRLWDDDAYIRSQTNFTYKTPDLGLEVGFEPGPVSWFVALTNGTFGTVDDNSGKMVTSSFAVVYPQFRVGASGSFNRGSGSDRRIVGGFAGTRLGPVALLGEGDLIHDTFAAGGDRDQLVAYAEGTVLVHKGVNLKAAYGYHDPDRDVPEDQRIRARFGLEFFPVSFLQLSGFYTLLQDVPAVTTDRDRVSLEAHVFF